MLFLLLRSFSGRGSSVPLMSFSWSGTSASASYAVKRGLDFSRLDILSVCQYELAGSHSCAHSPEESSENIIRGGCSWDGDSVQHHTRI